MPSHELLSKVFEGWSGEGLGEEIGELFLGVDLANLDAIASCIFDVGAKPVHLAIVELRAGSVLTRIHIGEMEAAIVVFPHCSLEIGRTILVKS